MLIYSCRLSRTGGPEVSGLKREQQHLALGSPTDSYRYKLPMTDSMNDRHCEVRSNLYS